MVTHRYAEDDLLPLSGIQHIAFCERQWALISIEDAWEDNVDTTTGELFHSHAHLQGYSVRDGLVAMRSMRIVSYDLGLAGFSDIVEFVPDDSGKDCTGDGVKRMPSPVEYKKGSPKRGPYDRLQVAAQVLCLEEMYGMHIAGGSLFYGTTRRRERIDVDLSLRDQVKESAEKMHRLFALGTTPPPVRRGACNCCSLTNECFPELEGQRVDLYWKGLNQNWG